MAAKSPPSNQFEKPWQFVPRKRKKKFQRSNRVPASAAPFVKGEFHVQTLPTAAAGFCPEQKELRCPLGATMFSADTWEAIACSLKLSGQELRFVRGVFDDYTERAIADTLKVSAHTVHTHSQRLYRKLHVADRTNLVLRIMDEFLALTATPESGLLPICSNRAAGRCPLWQA
jgi:DNA-binding CsgD family transcriptional regulator